VPADAGILLPNFKNPQELIELHVHPHALACEFAKRSKRDQIGRNRDLPGLSGARLA
jgi:hypothetical protein